MPAAGAKILRWRMPFVEILNVEMLVVTEEKVPKHFHVTHFQLDRHFQNKNRASRKAVQNLLI